MHLQLRDKTQIAKIAFTVVLNEKDVFGIIEKFSAQQKYKFNEIICKELVRYF